MTVATPPLPEPTWLEPEDAQRHWSRDLAHFPGQLTELDGELLVRFISDGFSQVMRGSELPFVFACRRLWTYYYDHSGRASIAEADRPAKQAQVARTLQAARNTIAERWHTEWRPEIEAHLAFWDAIDPFALSTEALAAHLDVTLERGARLWVVHFELAVAASTAKTAFSELYQELFTPDSPLEAQVLLSGFDVATTAAARALWPLRQHLSAGPLRDAFLAVAPRDALALLRDRPDATALLSELDTYLARYGQRCPYLLYSAPTLREEPASVLSMLRHMVERPDADPSRLHETQKRKREAAENVARERLRFYPGPVRSAFEAQLAEAQTAFIVGEDHNYLIDYTSTAHIRQVLLACGAHLQDLGVLERGDDVFHCRIDELRAALRGDVADLRERVHERQVELATYAAIEPPHDVNAPAPTDASSTAAAATDSAATAAADDEDDVLRGSAASSGVARGRARVLRELADTGALQPGEVLVAPTTGQAWTPLFATAAALVTEAGNLLSHSAVVAREYGLPAVVALANATRRIPDGALIEVDGSAGTVKVLSQP